MCNIGREFKYFSHRKQEFICKQVHKKKQKKSTKKAPSVEDAFVRLSYRLSNSY